MVGLTSAAGLVGFLSEPDPALRVFALERLNAEMDSVWPEVSGSIGQIEALYEDESFTYRELAALVLSKVYYQLQEYDESMVFALGAGHLFDPYAPHAGEYEETITAKCVDTYIALCALHNPPAPASNARRPSTQLMESFQANAGGAASTTAGMASPTTPFSQSQLPSKSLLSREGDGPWDASAPGGGNAGVPGAHPHPLTLPSHAQKNLQAIIRRIFESCYAAGAYRQVVGIAVEARNMDILREAMLRASGHDEHKGKAAARAGAASQSEELMEHVLDICMNVVQERALRNQILELVLELLHQIPSPDYFAIARCVISLDQHSMASDMLRQLVQKGDARSLAIAYQLSFDLYENGTQEFLQKVMEDLPDTDAEEKEKEEAPTMNGDAVRPGTPHPNQTQSAADGEQGTAAEHSGHVSTLVTSRIKPKPETEHQKTAYIAIRSILRGTKSIELNLEFLYRSSHADRAILNKIRDALEARNSIFHTAVTFATAFMHAGTAVDSFFRDNLEWMGKAANWSKFTATAALGVIHRGNLSQGQKLLNPYLPKLQATSGQGSVSSQGGSLYALGLVYANHGTNVLEYLREQFKATNEEVVQHGGALGLGVAGMGTGSEQIYDELKQVLYADSAINGEAVGLAMGLVMLGSANVKALEDMIQYSRETQHEKIVRGLAMGMALILYGHNEAADDMINVLLDDADPALRYGGIMTVALAYCGSGSNKAVRKLLHVAVSDVSDDVRRCAVMALGFVLFRKPGSVPRMVELLSESYNPHVRYGAAMALGIACAGTGLNEAVELLEPMTKDSVDFVRQGAWIALSMILVQQNDALNRKVSRIRTQLAKTISDRHEDAIAKFGAALALGIIDAGGRNCTIGLQTPTGQLHMPSIVGMAVFTQYWYWFPLTHFLSLSFAPTSVIGVDDKLEVPRLSFWCNTRPSLFDYPPQQAVKEKEEIAKVETAVLSTTVQARRRKAAKERRDKAEVGAMDVDPVTPATPKAPAETKEDATDAERMDVDDNVVDTGKVGEEKEGRKKGTGTEKEKVGYELENMCRVLPAQIKHVSFPAEGRWHPVKKPTGGVVLLIDTQPDEPKSLLELKATKKPAPPAAAPAGAAQTDTNMTDVAAPSSSGAAAAVGVLTAVDEDEEGGEEAPLPDAFDVTDEDVGEVDGEAGASA